LHDLEWVGHDIFEFLVAERDAAVSPTPKVADPQA